MKKKFLYQKSLGFIWAKILKKTAILEGLNRYYNSLLIFQITPNKFENTMSSCFSQFFLSGTYSLDLL